MTDRNGNSAVLPLSHDAPLYPQINAVPVRAAFLGSDQTREALFRRFAFPMADFVSVNEAFDPFTLAMISFVFDRSPSGAILIDDISISNPMPIDGVIDD